MTEFHEWELDIPRQRKTQGQSANLYLRGDSHREVIFDDKYHNAMYIGTDKLSCWRKYPYTSIVSYFRHSSDYYLGIIDLEHKVLHNSKYIANLYSLRKNYDFVYSIGGYNSTVLQIAKDGCEFQRCPSGANNMSYSSSPNNYRFRTECFGKSWHDGNTVPFKTLHFAYLEPIYDEDGVFTELQQHEIGTYENPNMRMTDCTHLTWTPRGALYSIDNQGYTSTALFEVTPDGIELVALLDKKPYEYEVAYSRLVQNENGMCGYGFTYSQKRSGSDFYDVHLYFEYSKDYRTWEQLWINPDEEILSGTSKEFRTILIASNSKFYLYVMQYTTSSDYYLTRLFVIDEDLNYEEIELPKYFDVPYDDEFTGAMVDSEYTQYSNIRIILDKDGENYEESNSLNLYAGSLLFGKYSLRFNTGPCGISMTNGEIDEIRPPFLYLDAISVGSSKYAYIYLDNLEFKESDKNFFFVTKAYDDSFYEEVKSGDYVLERR